MMGHLILLMHLVITILKYGKLFKPQNRRKNLSIVRINAGNKHFSFSGLVGHSNCKNDKKNLFCQGV